MHNLYIGLDYCPCVPVLQDALTWKCDVEPFVGDREVRYEAELGLEVAIETRIDGQGQFCACEAGEWLNKTPILSDEQIVMMILQVEGVKGELNAYWGNKTNAQMKHGSSFWSTSDFLVELGVGRKMDKKRENNKRNDHASRVNFIMRGKGDLWVPPAYSWGGRTLFSGPVNLSNSPWLRSSSVEQRKFRYWPFFCLYVRKRKVYF